MNVHFYKNIRNDKFRYFSTDEKCNPFKVRKVNIVLVADFCVNNYNNTED